MPEPVSVSLVIHSRSRTPEGIEKTRAILKSLGVEPTAAGLATVSCRVAPDRFEELFGASIELVPPSSEGHQDFGSKGGYMATEALSIPDELSEHVTAASVEPPVKRLNKRGGRSHGEEEGKHS